jgi:uncharacterized protein with GYD domain
MPKYLIEANLTREGLEGTVKEGGTSRRATVKAAIESVGGTLESFHYAFGDTDVFIICDLPSNEVAAGMAAKIVLSGSVATKTTVLLTPEEIDVAAKVTLEYRPPGA